MDIVSNYGSASSYSVKRDTPEVSAKLTNEDLIRMIASRLRLLRSDLMGVSMPFDHIFCAQLDNKVAIFVAKGDQFTVLEDSTELFPSDALMASLRLLRTG